jgi:hypothetical protein
MVRCVIDCLRAALSLRWLCSPFLGVCKLLELMCVNACPVRVPAVRSNFFHVTALDPHEAVNDMYSFCVHDTRINDVGSFRLHSALLPLSMESYCLHSSNFPPPLDLRPK